MSIKLIFENWKKYLHEVEENPAELDSQYDSAHVIIPESSGKVLLLKRAENDQWMPGKWSLPGGGKNGDETLLNAAVREVKEETGLDIDPNNMTFLDQISKQQNHAFFLAKNPIGTVRLDSENSEYVWMNPRDLEPVDCVPDLIAVLKSTFKLTEKVKKIPKDFEKKPFTNKLKGGAADKAKPTDFQSQSLRKGIEHEFEHSSDIEQAKETAADHLVKYKHYYDELEKMEKKLDKKKEDKK